MTHTISTFNHRLYKKKLKRFMLKGDEYGMPNTCLKIGKSELYVRRWKLSAPTESESRQVFLDFAKRQHINVLDIANVQIHKTAQRQGHFKKLLETSEKLARKLKYDIVHLECVNNKVLPPYITSIGYHLLPQLSKCYVKDVINESA